MSVAPAYTTVAKSSSGERVQGAGRCEILKADSYRSKHLIDLQGN